jgi:hypothetical protein
LGNDRRGKEPSSDFREEAASVPDERVRRWVDDEVDAVDAEDLVALGDGFIRRLAAMLILSLWFFVFLWCVESLCERNPHSRLQSFGSIVRAWPHALSIV